jgi:CDP-diacylglycerol--serine O-phosphatidyltransferase
MLISANPPMVLFLLFVAYAVSGYVVWAWNFRKSRSPF